MRSWSHHCRKSPDVTDICQNSRLQIWLGDGEYPKIAKPYPIPRTVYTNWQFILDSHSRNYLTFLYRNLIERTTSLSKHPSKWFHLLKNKVGSSFLFSLNYSQIFRIFDCNQLKLLSNLGKCYKDGSKLNDIVMFSLVFSDFLARCDAMYFYDDH